jgi:hypothetical protein
LSLREGKYTYLGSRYITDGKVSGVVKLITDEHVCLVDIVSGRHIRLHYKVCRKMTADEIEEYNSVPALGDPTADQIWNEITPSIKNGWDEATAKRRRKKARIPCCD